jgi:hypothetical protein
VTKGQALGCIGLAALSAAVAAISLVLGIICLTKEGLWNCAALVTIVPGALLAISYVALRIGLRAAAGPTEAGDFGFTRIEGERSRKDEQER